MASTPKKGELIIYPVAEGSNYRVMKAGDGETTLENLPTIGSAGGGDGAIYSITTNTSGARSGTYLSGSNGDSFKILNLYDISTTGSESSITNGRNSKLSEDIKYSQIFGTGHTIEKGVRWSLIRGQGHTIQNHTTTDVTENGEVVTVDGSTHNDISGLKNTVNGDYNTIHGTEFNVTGTHNVTFGVGGKCTINGKANMMAGDLTGSTITGNYNTILCGGGQNSLTGTTDDPCQHNVVLGSTTTLISAENCLTLGRLNTINNHDRAVLMGIGLTATRDNQLIVGSYNDDSRTGGVFVVGNGTSNSDLHIGSMGYGYELYIYDWSTTSNYYAKDRITNKIVRIFYTSAGWATSSNEVQIYSDDSVTYIMPTNEHDWDVYLSGKSNAMTVYKEGTVTIGHDPIGPMDVVTKQYLENALLAGQW